MTFRTCLAPGLALAAAALALPALAETELSDRATGAAYVLQDANANGELPLANKLDGEMDTYLLTPDCHAKHPIYGMGAWQAVDGGWQVVYSGAPYVSFEGDPPFPGANCPA